MRARHVLDEGPLTVIKARETIGRRLEIRGDIDACQPVRHASFILAIRPMAFVYPQR